MILTPAAGTPRYWPLPTSASAICSSAEPGCGRPTATNPTYVEALVIHEMMHTLGLGENPPSSLEINARVLKRCR